MLAIHDASFPAAEGEDSGRGTPYGRGGLAFAQFVRGLGFDGIQLGPQGQTSRINPSPYDGSLFSRNILSLDLAALVRHHRRAIPGNYGDNLPTRLLEPLRMTLFCLRFACILCRTRDTRAIPTFMLSGTDNRITVDFPQEWKDNHPLTMTDLQLESQQLKSLGIHFLVIGSEDA